MRWRPSAPLGVPRILSQDDTYQGYRFPKGTSFIMNTYSIGHDEEYFDDPENYIPERFLNNQFGVKPSMVSIAENQGHRPTWNFGAGRRMCPGVDYGINQVLVTTAKLAWAFNVSAIGKIDTSMETGFQSEIILKPKPFSMDLVPRSERKTQGLLYDFELARSVISKL
jgi:cytochrome P450